MSQPEAFVGSLDDDDQGSELPLYDTPRAQSTLTDPNRYDGLATSEERGAPDLYVLAVSRLGYGHKHGQRAEWNALGANEQERWDNYLKQQLDPDNNDGADAFPGHPGTIDDSDYTTRKAAAGYQTLDLTLHELWRDYERDLLGVTSSNDPQEECELDWFLRSIYTKRQLEQTMTEFWVDHFNIYSVESPTESIWPDWVKMLSGHAFGNFHSLLYDTAHHPAMLYYLDQYTSQFAGPNENYARELVELHTLGAENYLGVLPQAAVPNTKWAAYSAQLGGLFHPTLGIPDGYVDNDIFQAAAALAGWTFEGAPGTGAGETDGPTGGEYFFETDWHPNTAQMTCLGFGVINIQSTTPRALRGDRVLEMLAYHPGTARHVCRKLVRKFVSEAAADQDTPGSLVHTAADVFFTERNSPVQIRKVLEHIFASTEFLNSFGSKIKRPFEVIVSMLRATRAHFDFSLGGDETSSFLSHFGRTGHRPFRWSPPDGYPDVRGNWETAAPRVMTWRMGQWFADTRTDADNLFMPIRTITPGSVPRTPNGLVDYWLDRIFPQGVSASYREEIVDFMAQGFNPDTTLIIEDNNSTEWRLQMMIALIMATPEFSER